MSGNSQAVVLVCAIVAILINIVSVTMGVFFLSFKPTTITQGLSNGREVDGEPIACVTCQLRKGDRLLDGLTKRQINNQQHCCAQDSAGMSALMELIMREPLSLQEDTASQQTATQVSHKIRTSRFSISRASAHRQLLPAEVFNTSLYRTPVFTNQTVPLKLVHASYPEAITDHDHEVQVTDGGFMVIHPGVYYVYTNAMYKPKSNSSCRAFRYQTWEQEVRRRSALTGMRTTVMKSVHTCPDEQTKDTESSFTGGMFNLDQGDFLEVTTSGLGLLSFSPRVSYFGLFMLGEGQGSGSGGQ